MKKRVLLRETEKMTAYQPTLFFENQLVHARNKDLQRMLHSPEQPAHCLEEVSRFGGITFLDDTHTSDMESLYYSLDRIKHPILWITGGDDRNISYTSVLQLVVEKVKALICVGGRNEKLKSTFSPYLSTIYECESMEHAVKAAYYSAERDDVVLLSSACETMFADREQVSRMFRKATSEL